MFMKENPCHQICLSSDSFLPVYPSFVSVLISYHTAITLFDDTA